MFRKLLSYTKLPVAFASGVVFHHYYENNRHHFKYDQIQSQKFVKILEDEQMHHSPMYGIYEKVNNFDQFFEKLVLKENNGCSFFQIYISDELKDVAAHSKSIDEIEDLSKLKLYGIFNPNPQLQGHFNITHGGFSATLIDNLYGYLGTLSQQMIPCATGGLNLKYKRPVFVNKEYMIQCYVKKIDGRKVIVHSNIIDSKGRVCVESDAMMIRVKWNIQAWQFLFNNLKKVNNVSEILQKKLDIDFFEAQNHYKYQRIMFDW